VASAAGFRVAIYCRVSTHDQQTLPLQLRELRAYARRRGWRVVAEVQEVRSGAKARPGRDGLLAMARRREADAVLVWRLDRWGRSTGDLITTLDELTALGVGFVSLREALDLTTPAGRALAGMLAVFAAFEREVLRERVLAGLERARADGTRLGRPRTVGLREREVRGLARRGVGRNEIARQTGISRKSVYRMLLPRRRGK
jgi:DNA invertase Pin-like site-specific DNA recombinase